MNTKILFLLTLKTWIVTVFPSKKNLVPRFESRKELEDRVPMSDLLDACGLSMVMHQAVR